MKPTDLALNQVLGIVAAPVGATHLLELPLTPQVVNHVGSMHAAAQFALAEAAGAAGLQRDFPDVGNVFAVVRGARIKYRKPALGDLLAFATCDDATLAHLRNDLATRTHASATVQVELKDRAGNLTLAASFDWFISQPKSEI